jgi:hypothetical protein
MCGGQWGQQAALWETVCFTLQHCPFINNDPWITVAATRGSGQWYCPVLYSKEFQFYSKYHGKITEELKQMP